MPDALKDVNNDDAGIAKKGLLIVFKAALQITFFLYDCVVFLPFQIFANPGNRLVKSARVKARPIKEGDPSTPYRHIDVVDGELKCRLYPECGTVAEVWKRNAVAYGDQPCLGTREVLEVHKEKQKNGKVFEKWVLGEYHFRTYAEVAERVNLVGSALVSIGLKQGEHVVIFADTREEWMTTAHACFARNFPIATVYATLGEDAVLFAFKEVNADTIFTTTSLLPKVYKALENGAEIKNIVYFESQDPEERKRKVEGHKSARVLSFEELMKLGTSDDPKELVAKPDDVAMTMYTSGTTGNPKGVMITHANIVAATCGQATCSPLDETDVYIGYLPLAHILEVCGEIIIQSRGGRIGYSSAQTLFDTAGKIKKGTRGDCYVLKPTLMAAVPAVLDRIYKAVIDNVNSSSPLKREIFHACYARKIARYEDGYKSMLMDKLIFNAIRKLLGGNIRIILCGGAPLSAETQRFVNICFSCPVVQGYGLTETCGGGTIADVDDLSTGTVGPPISCCQILLREWKDANYSPKNDPPQGELLIAGGNVAKGYYKNEQKTKEDFVEIDGERYFCTGDIGEIREDGSIKVIDRKKDLLKLAHGEYISLGKVETAILTNPLIENVCAYGDSSKDFLVALVVPNHKNLLELAEKQGVDTSDYEKACEDENVVKEVQKVIASHVGNKLSRVETPQRVYLCHEPWTPQSGLLTEALKLKRRDIEKAFKKQIDELYKK